MDGCGYRAEAANDSIRDVLAFAASQGPAILGRGLLDAFMPLLATGLTVRGHRFGGRVELPYNVARRPGAESSGGSGAFTCEPACLFFHRRVAGRALGLDGS